MVENVAAAANLATEEKAATVVTAGKVDKVANVATVVKAVTTGAMEKVAKVEIAFLSYNIISLLRISRRGRCVFTYNAR